MTSIVCYDTILDDPTVLTATDTDAAYSVDNLKTWTEWDQWKAASAGTKYITLQQSGSVDPNYVALFGHNFADEAGVTVTLEWSTDNFAADINTLTTLTVTEGVMFKPFAAIGSKAYYRLKIVTSALVPSLGVFALGVYTALGNDMSAGFKPALVDYYEAASNTSMTGTFLGRSLYRAAERTNITLRNLAPAWVRSTYLGFLAHAQAKPFFFCWDVDSYEDEAVYCWADRGVESPVYQDALYMRHSLSVMAKI